MLKVVLTISLSVQLILLFPLCNWHLSLVFSDGDATILIQIIKCQDHMSPVRCLMLRMFCGIGPALTQAEVS